MVGDAVVVLLVVGLVVLGLNVVGCTVVGFGRGAVGLVGRRVVGLEVACVATSVDPRVIGLVEAGDAVGSVATILTKSILTKSGK